MWRFLVIQDACLTNLYNYVGFYVAWPDFFHALRGKSMEDFDILNSLCSQSPIRLSWTHYRIILQENTDRGRAWYEQEAACDNQRANILLKEIKDVQVASETEFIPNSDYSMVEFYQKHLIKE